MLELGPVPCDESCAQVGDDNYNADSRRECTVYRRMLERVFGWTPDSPFRFSIRSFPHDFGRYREVVVMPATAATDFWSHACRIEHDAPTQWDTIARYELVWYAMRASFMARVRDGINDLADVPVLLWSSTPPPVPADLNLAQLLQKYPIAFSAPATRE